MQQIHRTFAALSLAFLAACATPRGGDRDVNYHAAEGAIGPYSGAVSAGAFCFVSGKIGVRGGTFAEQANSAIDRVAEELDRVGLTLADVVAATVYLTDMGRYGEFNEIYGARFSEPYPARVCVAVAELPAEAAVEVQVVARRPGPR